MARSPAGMCGKLTARRIILLDPEIGLDFTPRMSSRVGICVDADGLALLWQTDLMAAGGVPRHSADIAVAVAG